MATALEVQAVLDPQGTGKLITIIKGQPVMPANTSILYYCIGGQGRAGLARWVECTVADNAATQAAAIEAAMVHDV